MVNLFAQSPEKMSYQAIIRNSSDQMVTDQQIGMQISILLGSANGTAIYVETQTPTTNANGLLSIEVGTGTVLSGDFSNINWANGIYFIKTEIDLIGGTDYKISGTSQLLSVPYALYAKTAESLAGGITETDPLFSASATSAITVSDINEWNNKLEAEVDGSVTNELQVLSISNDTIYLTEGGFIKLPVVFNGDYGSLINAPDFTGWDTDESDDFDGIYDNLTNKPDFTGWDTDVSDDFDGQYESLAGAPTDVSSFSNDAGYLTTFTEIDGDVTNELQIISLSNDTIYLTDGGSLKLPPSNSWNLAGNTGTNGALNFIGTTDAVDLVLKTLDTERMRIKSDGKIGIGTSTPLAKLDVTGGDALINGVTVGRGGGNRDYNTTVGNQAMPSNTGMLNTAIGYFAMQANTSGSSNVAIGSQTLKYNAGGSNNVAIGDAALLANNGGGNNVAVGSWTLSTGWGSGNTGVGYSALKGTYGSYSTAVGYASLTGYTTSQYATAVGAFSMMYPYNISSTWSNYNVAFGYEALRGSTTGGANSGNYNSAIGSQVLKNNTSGSNNTSLGFQSLNTNTTGNNNVTLGYQSGFSNSTGSNNIFLGYMSGYYETGSDKLYIANSSTDTPLVYGDFNTAELTVNGNLNINNAYTFPSVDGTTGQVMTTDGTGNIDWSNLSMVAASGSYKDLNDLPTIQDTINKYIDGSETKLTAGTNITITGNGTTASPYTIETTPLLLGQAYQGGIIFWLDVTGQHGLIAAVEDQHTAIQWHNGTGRYTGTTGDGLYGGEMNTAMIVAAQIADNPSGNFAAKVCADYSVAVDGITNGDWYLPSSYELNLLYLQKDVVGGFSDAYYWSSSENDNNSAWAQYFLDGTNGPSFDKGNFDRVRAIRAF